MRELLSEKMIGAEVSPYTLNQVVFEKSAPGKYTINIDKGIFEVSICGAGVGGGGSATSHSWFGSNGGSGAAFKGLIKFAKTTLKITIGKGGAGGLASGKNTSAGTNGLLSSIFQGSTNIISAGAGNGRYGTGIGAGTNNGNGGTLTIGNADSVSEIIKSNGVKSSTVSILGNGYGAGGAYRASNSGTNGQNGYVKILFKRSK